jgi:hypothetical protein
MSSRNMVTNGYDALTVTQLIAEAINIHEQMTANTAIFATPTPTSPVFKDGIDELVTAAANAKGRDIYKLAILEDKRLAMLGMVAQRGSYVNMIAQGDETIVILAGYRPRKKNAPRILTLPSAPATKLGLQRGDLNARIKQPEGFKNATWYITDDMNKPLSQWEQFNNENTRITFTGRELGKIYFICVEVFGARKQSFVSGISSIVA